MVPLSVLSNWMAEFERFCPSMRCVRFHGPKARPSMLKPLCCPLLADLSCPVSQPERARIKIEELNDVREFDVVVTTYEILVSEANFFRRKVGASLLPSCPGAGVHVPHSHARSSVWCSSCGAC